MNDFKTPKNGNDMMPFYFGPRSMGEKLSGWYNDVTMLVIPYLTDDKLLKSIIPEPFKLLDDPIITVTYACNKNIDWLAGRDYNLISVSVKTKFDGVRDNEIGTFNLVMWENLTDPILTGRELQGIPKIYADIQNHQLTDGVISTNVSHYNNSILDMSITNMFQLDANMVTVISDSEKNLKSFGLRYIPDVDITNPPLLVEPILHTSQNFFKEIHLGNGSVNWHASSWEKNPTQAHIVNKLKELPIIEYKDSYYIKGSANLFVLDKPSVSLK
jgi:acetoacetate decarboxylase|tara:strand:- start:1212 stop:2027 length:816 start_codon:yes stop_codon:yes gene_type:complete